MAVRVIFIYGNFIVGYVGKKPGKATLIENKKDPSRWLGKGFIC
jgi:hypothetical protein